jgi:hypothetical protein
MPWWCAECKWFGIAWVTEFNDGDTYNKLKMLSVNL